MRFVDLSIPKCTYWLEKLNVLFLVDKEKGLVPYINPAIAPSENGVVHEHNSIDAVMSQIYPEDLNEFRKLLNGTNGWDQHRELRLKTTGNGTITFRISSIRIGSPVKRRLLVALPLEE